MPFPVVPETARDLLDGYEFALAQLGEGGTRIQAAGGVVALSVYEFRWTFPESFIAELPNGAPLKARLLTELET